MENKKLIGRLGGVLSLHTTYMVVAKKEQSGEKGKKKKGKDTLPCFLRIWQRQDIKHDGVTLLPVINYRAFVAYIM